MLGVHPTPQGGQTHHGLRGSWPWSPLDSWPLPFLSWLSSVPLNSGLTVDGFGGVLVALGLRFVLLFPYAKPSIPRGLVPSNIRGCRGLQNLLWVFMRLLAAFYGFYGFYIGGFCCGSGFFVPKVSKADVAVAVDTQSDFDRSFWV